MCERKYTEYKIYIDFINGESEKVEEFKIMKTVRFKSFQEKIKLMMKLQKQYNKVVADDSKMIIVCYNKSF